MTFSLINIRYKGACGGRSCFIYIILAFSLLSFPLISTEGFCPDQRAFEAKRIFLHEGNERAALYFTRGDDNLLCLLVSNEQRQTCFLESRVVEAPHSKLPALSLPSPTSGMPRRQPWSFNRKKTKKANVFLLSSFLFLSLNYEGGDALEVWLLRASCHKPMDTKQSSLWQARSPSPPQGAKNEHVTSRPNRVLNTFLPRNELRERLRDTNWTFLFF